jgi:flagellar hook-length control protein FliK
MTIETGPSPQPSHKATASAGSHGARPKAGAAAPDAGSAGAGFLGILGALGDAVNDTPAQDAVGIDALAADTPASATTGLTVAPAFDASSWLQQNPQIAAAQALQLAASSAAPVLGVPLAAPSATPPALDAGRRLPADPAIDAAQAALAASTAAPALGSPLAPPAAGAATAPRAGEAAAKPALAQGLAAGSLVSTAVDAQDLAPSTTQGLQQAFTRARAGKEFVQSGGDGASATSSNSAAATERAEPGKLLAAMEQARAAAGASTPEPVWAPLVVKQEKSQAERERSGFELKGSEPTYSGSSLGASTVEAPQSGAAAQGLAPEMQVAEQVSYWVSHNVQNAELSLDGLGQSPVQVSISLQGNEAQISFRTDEAAAREVLQNAGAHLKDMLQREGLVLAGVTVGHSGSGNADGGERRPRQNVRQALIAPLQVASVEARAGLRGAVGAGVGRSVDLFV